MKRVVIVGPGASGKSTLAVRLGEVTGLPVIKLDKIFWQPGLVATRGDRWVQVQQMLVEPKEWILDGDLGPDDAVEVRLRAADTVIFLDFSLVRCAWRAVRRSRERARFLDLAAAVSPREPSPSVGCNRDSRRTRDHARAPESQSRQTIGRSDLLTACPPLPFATLRAGSLRCAQGRLSGEGGR
jgi:adenylate kinase family enzyme